MSDEFRKLPKQPLNCVLAEFRYTKILKISDHIPDIQESIREIYPVLGNGDQQVVQVTGQKINVVTSSEWVFGSSDEKSAVIIGSDRMVFITSEYARFPEFSDQCLYILKSLYSIAKPSLLLRIGLRYNDYIVIDDPEKASEVIDPKFLPLDKLTCLGDGEYQYRTESSLKTAEGTLLMRSFIGKHGLSVMPDLEGSLPIVLKFAGDKEKLALLLDYDHSWAAKQPGEDFNLGVAKRHLDDLHSVARKAFWATTTENARTNIWT